MTGRKKKGEAKAPPAKSTLRPKTVPRVHPQSSGQTLGYLFSADDVAGLAAQAGVPLKTVVEPDSIATHLHNAFDLSLSLYGTDVSRSAPAERRDWFSELQRNATALLKTLGHENPDDTLRIFPHGPSTSKQNLVSEFFDSELYKTAHILPVKVRNLVNQKALQDALEIRREHAAVSVEPVSSLAKLQTFQRVAVLPLLEIAPWLIALLAELGRAGAARYSKQAGKRTKPKECWREALFCHLAGAYDVMTGNLPNVRAGELRDPGAPAVKWFQAVLAMAASRADSVFTLENLVPSAAIRPLSAKSAATIAGYIERGNKAWRARKA